MQRELVKLGNGATSAPAHVRLAANSRVATNILNNCKHTCEKRNLKWVLTRAVEHTMRCCCTVVCLFGKRSTARGLASRASSSVGPDGT